MRYDAMRGACRGNEWQTEERRRRDDSMIVEEGRKGVAKAVVKEKVDIEKVKLVPEGEIREMAKSFEGSETRCQADHSGPRAFLVFLAPSNNSSSTFCAVT
jgi:hypothetical protein